MGNVTKKPCIFAGDMSPEELRIWLNQMANSAGVYSDGIESLAVAVQSLQSEAALVGDQIIKKIKFLSDPGIIRSEEHSAAIKEDLHLLSEMYQSITVFHQAIETSIKQLFENKRKGGFPAEQVEGV